MNPHNQNLSSGGSSGGLFAPQIRRFEGTNTGQNRRRSFPSITRQCNRFRHRCWWVSMPQIICRLITVRAGGSVSIPSAFNGIYSIKPSNGRISFKDAANSVCDCEAHGFRGRDADLDLVTRPNCHPYGCRYYGCLYSFPQDHVSIVAHDETMAQGSRCY